MSDSDINLECLNCDDNQHVSPETESVSDANFTMDEYPPIENKQTPQRPKSCTICLTGPPTRNQIVMKWDAVQTFLDIEKPDMSELKEENLQLKRQINALKQKNLRMSSGLQRCDKNANARSKQLQTLISVGTFKKPTKTKKHTFSLRKEEIQSKKYPNTQLLGQLRHEQSIHQSLNQELEELKKEIKILKNDKATLVQKLDESAIPELEKRIIESRNKIMTLEHTIRDKEETMEKTSKEFQEFTVTLTADHEKEIKHQEEQLREMDDDIAYLNTKLKGKEDEINGTEEQLKKQKNRLTSACEKNEDLTNTMNALKQQSEEKKKSIEKTQEELQHKEADLKHLQSCNENYWYLLDELNLQFVEKDENKKMSGRVIEEWKFVWCDIMDKQTDERQRQQTSAISLQAFFHEMDEVVHNLSNELNIVKTHLQQAVDEYEELKKRPKKVAELVIDFPLPDVEIVQEKPQPCEVNAIVVPDTSNTSNEFNVTDQSNIHNISNVIDTPNVLDTPKEPDISKVPDTSNVLDIYKAPDTPRVSEVPEVNDKREPLDTLPVLNASDTPGTFDVSDMPKAINTPKTVGISEISGMPKAVDTPKASDTSKAVDTPKAVDTSKA
ncbi:hypothetical protein RFI_17206, partial [Reticulomyxa filosa]